MPTRTQSASMIPSPNTETHAIGDGFERLSTQDVFGDKREVKGAQQSLETEKPDTFGQIR